MKDLQTAVEKIVSANTAEEITAAKEEIRLAKEAQQKAEETRLKADAEKKDAEDKEAVAIKGLKEALAEKKGSGLSVNLIFIIGLIVIYLLIKKYKN